MKIVLDDLQSVQYLKTLLRRCFKANLCDERLDWIAERKLGPENTETGELEEVSSIYFHTSNQVTFLP